MPDTDTLSHPSLGGLYIKAQELDMGHAAPPAMPANPPGCPSPGALADADAHASSSPSARHTSSASASASPGSGAADTSEGFSIEFDEARAACTIRFHCFDVPNKIVCYGVGNPDGAASLLEGAKDLCLELHARWSFSSPDSDVARINGKTARVLVDPRTADLIAAMRAFHDGEPLFDFTIGRLSFLWKRASKLPSAEAIRVFRSCMGAEKISVRRSVVEKTDIRTQVDVGGAAKGAAADMVAAMLRHAGVASAEVNLGGNLYMLGRHPSGRPWRVDVRIPDGIGAGPVTIDVSDASLVTSGSYERYVEIDGKRYQHIVDPRTGWPSESDVLSASVVSANSLQADMLATTACLAGSAGFDELASRHPSCRFVAILDDGTVLDSLTR